MSRLRSPMWSTASARRGPTRFRRREVDDNFVQLSAEDRETTRRARTQRRFSEPRRSLAGNLHRPEAMQFRHILCPIDFSEPSRAAMQMAAELARSSGGVLTLLHVTQMSKIHVHRPMGTASNVAARRPALALERWRMEAASGGGISVRAEVRAGVPIREIIDWLEGTPTCDLVVMGSHGRTGLRHTLAGSVAERVVRLAPCPVLVIRARSRALAVGGPRMRRRASGPARPGQAGGPASRSH